MRKFLAISVLCCALIFSAKAYALDVQFRTGPSFNVSKWIDTQYKLGFSFSMTNKGAESGFYSATSFEYSFGNDTSIIWLMPEFMYDIKLGGLPLYIYPKLALDIFFAFYPASVKGLGFGIKPAIGVKYDLMEWLYVWCEPFGMHFLFAQYVFSLPSAATGGAFTKGWDKGMRMAYDLMFGVGFRI